jgi:hypothetical protein
LQALQRRLARWRAPEEVEMKTDMTGSPGRWRFVKAGDLHSSSPSFDRLEVRSTTADERLGKLKGFIVDTDGGRLQYVVVDSGGWFTGGTYLIPPAYTRVDAEQNILWAEATRDTIGRFPEFDSGEYPTLSDEQLWGIERRIIEAYGDDPGILAPSASWDRQTWAQYRQPDWWRQDFYDTATVRRSDPAIERAQPGDVLGIERAGETTSLGATREDEDRKRESAEKAYREASIREERDRAADRRSR